VLGGAVFQAERSIARSRAPDSRRSLRPLEKTRAFGMTTGNDGNKNCGEFVRIGAMNTLATETVLVPANTVVTAKGDGPAVDLSGAGRIFLVTLSITKIIEQESLDVSIFGSADGAAWEPKSLAAFRQEFYCGEYPLLLDLSAHTNVKFVRAHWEVARWGRGTETPMFEFGVAMKEVPAEILREATVR
jgi:hypothetical protein